MKPPNPRPPEDREQTTAERLRVEASFLRMEGLIEWDDLADLLEEAADRDRSAVDLMTRVRETLESLWDCTCSRAPYYAAKQITGAPPIPPEIEEDLPPLLRHVREAGPIVHTCERCATLRELDESIRQGRR